jgi:hypothetical protein
MDNDALQVGSDERKKQRPNQRLGVGAVLALGQHWSLVGVVEQVTWLACTTAHTLKTDPIVTKP